MNENNNLSFFFFKRPWHYIDQLSNNFHLFKFLLKSYFKQQATVFSSHEHSVNHSFSTKHKHTGTVWDSLVNAFSS